MALDLTARDLELFAAREIPDGTASRLSNSGRSLNTRGKITSREAGYDEAKLGEAVTAALAEENAS